MIRKDFPGENTTLQPDKAPVWLRKAVTAARASQASAVRQSDARAAVLVLFSGDPNSTTLPEDATVVMTHRSPSLRSHSGQCAFPGGRIDASDINSVDAALREAWEEIGLDRRTVLPLAQLAPARVRRSRTPVCPVIAYWHHPMSVGVHSPDELDAVFPLRIADLKDPSNRMVTVQGDYVGPGFSSHGYVIWGFTARVLAHLMQDAQWIGDWRDAPSVDLQVALKNSRNHENEQIPGE